MNEQLLEAIYTVDKLNNDFYDLTNNSDVVPVTLVYGTYGFNIEFFGVSVWCSEDDYREYIDEENDIREPIFDFVIRELNNTVLPTLKTFKKMYKEIKKGKVDAICDDI